MNLKDEIYYGYITQKSLSYLIDQNTKHAAELNITAQWECKGESLYSRLYTSDKVIYVREFTGEHLHIMIAKMHFNWSLIFDKQIKARNHAAYIERMKQREALGGQNYDVVDEPEDTRPTLGERVQKYGIGNK